MIEDVAYLEEWFDENETCFIIPYIERNFHGASFNHQHNYMREHLFFTKKVIEDDKMSDDEKKIKLLDALSFGKSKIIVIVGARGSGKTATAAWIMDELHKKGLHKRIYFVKEGDRPTGMPDWIKVVNEVEEVKKGSIAIVDESAIKYNNRAFYKDENKDFISRLVILRHNDISVILITQHEKMIDIGIRRLTDIRISKQYALTKGEDESFDDEKVLVRERLKARSVEECLVEMKGMFMHFSHELPEWWDDTISKAFAGYNPEAVTRQNKAKKEKKEFNLD